MAKKEKQPLSIVDRRLASGSIFGTSSKPIPLTEPDRWTVRLVNSQISEGHLYDMQAEKGWIYAEVGDLAVKPEEVGLRAMDGRLVRGTHGHEVLMKMEKKDYRAVQKAKDVANRQSTFGKKAIKNAVVSAAGAEPDGDRGASFLNRAMDQVSVTDTLERVNLDD